MSSQIPTPTSSSTVDFPRTSTSHDPRIDAEIDKALSTRRGSRHLRHRSSISMSLFKKTADPSGDGSSFAGSTREEGEEDPFVEEEDFGATRVGRDGAEGVGTVSRDESSIGEGDFDEEASSAAESRRRASRFRLRKESLKPTQPIQLLVKKPEEPVHFGATQTPSPLRADQHIHFPENTKPAPNPVAGPSNSGPAEGSDRPPSPSASVSQSQSQTHLRGRSNSSGEKVVNLLAADKAERKEAKEEVRRLKRAKEREYCWDVLFENQRGILFLGNPHFSSSSLIPWLDPPAYTVPIHEPKPVETIPTTNRSASQDPSPHNVLLSSPFKRKRHKNKNGHHGHDGEHGHRDYDHTREEFKKAVSKHENHKIRASMATPYTLKTFQPPSPQWEFITPWMINMQQDSRTDERGWQYNFIFRNGGWSAKVGWSGWGRWTRRRMWVRLRTVKLEEEEREEEEEDWMEGEEGEWEREAEEGGDPGFDVPSDP